LRLTKEPTSVSAITVDVGEFEWIVDGVGSFAVQLVVAVLGTSPQRNKELLHVVKRVQSAGGGTHR
jgi:hypothetical protein